MYFRLCSRSRHVCTDEGRGCRSRLTRRCEPLVNYGFPTLNWRLVSAYNLLPSYTYLFFDHLDFDNIKLFHPEFLGGNVVRDSLCSVAVAGVAKLASLAVYRAVSLESCRGFRCVILTLHPKSSLYTRNVLCEQTICSMFRYAGSSTSVLDVLESFWAIGS